jgi:hypothetical protein
MRGGKKGRASAKKEGARKRGEKRGAQSAKKEGAHERAIMINRQVTKGKRNDIVSFRGGVSEVGMYRRHGTQRRRITRGAASTATTFRFLFLDLSLPPLSKDLYQITY